VQITSNEGSTSLPTNVFEMMAKEASGLMPTRQLDHTEMGEVVRLALETLNERQRMAVLLSKFEDMSYQDIADTMGDSVQAIKSLLSRARASLKQALNPYLQEGLKPLPDPRSRMIRAADTPDPDA
jgi:RNA polymerase sigma-70 factor (ECF subfamily)